MSASKVDVRKVTGAPEDLVPVAAEERSISGQTRYVQLFGSPVLKTLLDDTGAGGITYVGEAEPGTATSAASWRIKRITETGADVTIEWSNGSVNFDVIWNDRASLSYS